MKTWNAPEVEELNINETAGGFFKVGYEGPFDIILGDKEDKEEDKKDDTVVEES